MPEISLLEPTVLRGVVEKLTAPESLSLTASLPKQPYPFPSAVWDVIRGSRMIAKPNVPNSEAHIVAQLGRSQASATFIYLREKKVFSPTTLHWLRAPGEIAKKNAEAAVLREITDLNQRFDNYCEWLCWQALRGGITIDEGDVQASVDYGFAASHKTATASQPWDDLTPTTGASFVTVRDDIATWKRLVARDGRVAATDAWASEPTLNMLMNVFANQPLVLSDRMKDEFWSKAVIPGFQGMDWHTVEQVYDDDNGDVQQFVGDNELFFTNLSTGRAMEIMEGPTADDEAPQDYTGKFSKTWKEKDPSARQFLLEWHLLPVITRPEQIVYIPDVTA